MKFPNKVVSNAYNKAIGREFTHSPSRQVFTDEKGCSDYNYYAMLWLLHNNVLVEQPACGSSIVYKYKIK